MGGAAHVRVVIAASLAGLLFGFDTAVISGVTGALRQVFTLTPLGLGATVSSALWGTLIGATTLGRPGDRFGSRNMLRLVGLLYFVSAFGCASAWNLTDFVIWRFVAGIAIGGSSVLAPVYLAEIAPAKRRGAIVGLFQANIVAGILLAYGSNFCVARWLSGADVWRYKLAMAAVPAWVFLSLLFTIPHSPRWLAFKGAVAQAESSLRRLGCADPQAQLAEYSAGGAGHHDTRQRLSWIAHRRPILLAIGLACFNQLSGINAILYYLGDIFAAAGFSGVSADAQSIAVGAMNLCATIVGMVLIDRLGRKVLLMWGSVGMATSLFGVSLVMANEAARGTLLILLVGFIACFALSQGAVIWVYLSEIFPTAVRARGQSLGSAAHWLLNALISAVFPAVAAYHKAAPFIFFALMMVLQFIIVRRLFPETRGVPLELIEQMMHRHNMSSLTLRDKIKHNKNI